MIITGPSKEDGMAHAPENPELPEGFQQSTKARSGRRVARGVIDSCTVL